MKSPEKWYVFSFIYFEKSYSWDQEKLTMFDEF